ncbi:serine/threonine-protein kinase LMTK2 [Sardina pilchardus]|uniref:serine/threonine-protein kinase LMTK2 n=1 Tax=Sardina pilchardus TaxID=27697 RepID=UPI002E1416FB
MESHHGCLLWLGIWTLQLTTSLVQCVPLPYSDRVELGEEALQLSLLVSVCALVVLVVVLFNCVSCCKEREINFKEFEDNFEDEIDFTPPAEDTPSMQSPAEVYTLAVPPVAMPGPPHLDLPRIADGSSGPHVARHTLSYIQEIGSGWFGKVLLSEIYADPGASRVVVQELKANAGAKEQNDFLQQGDPYRVLQHPNILQCLGQCVEAIPFLLVFEYCDLGDLKSYLAQQDWRYGKAELLQLQRMACEVAAGVTHLHKHNFLHSDLALRNCFLTADLTVKVGDYGIGPYRYKEDYITTEEDQLVPLRWLAPELVGDLHGGVITAEQTKPGNVWSLGITLWELFENANQPYPHLSDREVLNHVIRDQQIKLFKPQLDLPYSERWYEVLQFCWLPPDKRATAEEVHRLLTYLRMQGQKDVEDDFEQRWNALRPNPCARQTTVSHSSFPILETLDEGGEPDEMLTVTETSRGLSFEYVWEGAKHDHYDSHSRAALDSTLNYNSVFFPVPSQDIHALFPPSAGDPGAHHHQQQQQPPPPQRVSPPGQGVPGVLPVFDAREVASGKDYYIQLEDQEESTTDSQDLVAKAEPPPPPAESQHFLMLHDARMMDESSTDADFFHGSLDSKDSFMPDSHTWSSSEHDSPFHTNIFSEGDASKLDEPHSWRTGFLDLPEMGGHSNGGFQQGSAGPDPARAQTQARSPPSTEQDSPAFSGPDGRRDVLLLEEDGGTDDDADFSRLLNTEKLADNFLFLKEKSLMKESPDSGKLDQNANSAGSPITSLLESEELAEKASVTEDTAKSVANVSPLSNAELLHFSDADFGGLLQPLGNETLVPSKPSLSAEAGSSSNLSPVSSASPGDEPTAAPLSPGSEISLALSSTSPSAEALAGPVPVCLATGPQSPVLSPSATPEMTCAVAKTPSIDDPLDLFQDHMQVQQHIGTDFTELNHVSSSELVGSLAKDKDPYSAVSLTDSAVDVDKGLDTETDHLPTCTDEESSFADGLSQDRTSLQVSEPCLDQISQDSLLDDSLSSPLPTTENSAETPDSLDSLDIHRLGGQEEAHGTPAPCKLQPPYKTADSGYETENLESPEWNSQPVQDGASRESEEAGGSSAEAPSTPLVPPEIVVSEVENGHEEAADEEAQQREGAADQQEEAPPSDVYITGSYRDSAYFSDNELETDRRSEETNGGTPVEAPAWLGESAHAEPRSTGDAVTPPQETPDPQTGTSAVTSDPASGLIDAAALPESTRNGVPEPVLGAEENRAEESLVSAEAPQQEAQKTATFSDASSSVPAASTEPSAKASANVTEPPARPPLDNMSHAKLTRTYAAEITRRKEPDSEGRYLSRREAAAAAALAAAAAGEDGREDGMDADEEDENSDDSDDERHSAYRLHSSSEESEDDVEHPVPQIICDTSDAGRLKSLLKPAALAVDKASAAADASDNDGSKRAVSFFDDVTVYLFDQETPTKELGDHTLGSNSQVSEFSSPAQSTGYLNRFTNSTESSTDEEGGGFEWDDDFSSSDSSFLAKAASDVAASKPSPLGASRYFSPPPQNRGPDTSWTSSSSYSRFSISPASIASFSLTHLTDSDIEQGGSSEDGERD